MGYVALNNAKSTLPAAINNSVTSIPVQAGHGARFILGAGEYTYLTLENAAGAIEIVKQTARSSDSLTVVRGQDGTTALSWNIGDIVECRPCVAAMNDKMDALWNVLRTFKSLFTNSNTAVRTYTLPDADGVLATTDQLGLRNKVYNGNFTPLQVINQRGAASRVATNAAYNYDCWYYQTVGQKLTTPIDSLDLKDSATYTVNWTGTATCEWIQSASDMATVVGGGVWAPILKGAQLTTSATTVSGGLHLFVRFIGVDATLATLDKVQVEPGSAATVFEQKSRSSEFQLCTTRCYSKDIATPSFVANGYAANATSGNCIIPLPRMRKSPITMTPTGSFVFNSNVSTAASLSLGSATPDSAVINMSFVGQTPNTGGMLGTASGSASLLFEGADI